MSKFSKHASWLQLLDIVGPFISVKQLDAVFPQGLDAVYPESKKRVRSAYNEWRDAIDTDDAQLPMLHEEWIRLVLQDFLQYAPSDLTAADAAQPCVVFKDDLTGATFAPDFILHGTDNAPFMFIKAMPPNTGSRKPPTLPIDDMTRLCRARSVRLGLVTNGEQWTLVHAPVDGMSSAISWYARFWFQEPQTLQAFSSLLGVRRFFGAPSETLPALMDKAGEHQQTITNALGAQVRTAVEVLIQSLDRADEDRNRELLRDVPPATLYEACLTVMMRLVFLLCAEERDLLLLGAPVYDANYAITLLRGRLAEMADLHGAEVLERRYDAWAQIIAVFRAVYFGIEHENLHLPALGGSLFDPEKYPFLEGRKEGASSGSPVPIDNRTVLLLLTSLQVIEQAGGALVQSYRALDVEQIGYIYEGLLEHTARKTTDVALGLLGSEKAKNPNAELSQLESLAMDGEDALVAFLKERTGRSPSALRNALHHVEQAFLPVPETLAKRIAPFAKLIRPDAWGKPQIYHKGAFMVTLGTDRRESGTHYTPKALTERIVKSALEPVVYIGPSEGKPRDKWQLKPPSVLLSLKICDPAMGSGAFLVQACRYLADRLVEAWDATSNSTLQTSNLPAAPADRLAEARRLVSEKCLYGVDINPLAVELAKLSLWLVTISKGRPFGYLDHNLRAGDSLLGIHDVNQLKELRLKPAGTGDNVSLFGQDISTIIDSALKDRLALRETRILDIRDVERMTELDKATRHKLENVECFADLFCGTVLATKGTDTRVQSALETLPVYASELLGQLASTESSGKAAATRQSDKSEFQKAVTQGDLFSYKPNLKPIETDYAAEAAKLLGNRHPFHWAIEFPEVFAEGGFDAICGNPPFSGGQHLTGTLGTDYRDYLVRYLAEGKKGSADLVAYFYLRAYQLLRPGGVFGLIACNTIAEGDTRQVGLERMVKQGAEIIAAAPNMPWPGEAAVVISPVTIYKGAWHGDHLLNGLPVPMISAFLSAQDEWSPLRLKANENQSFQGSIVLGMGFTMSETEAKALIAKNPKNAEALFPYLNGEDLNTDPEQKPSRWVINFFDWSLDRCRRDYLDLLAIVEEKVKPERTRLKADGSFVLRKPLPERWWQYGEKRPGLYHAIGRGASFVSHPKGWTEDTPMQRVLAITLVSKTLAFALVPSEIVFANLLAVFALSSFSDFAVMQSNVHASWAWRYCSKMKNDLRYCPVDAFETFPFPSILPPELEKLGQAFDALRREMMRRAQIGLTRLYNAFHDSDCVDLEEASPSGGLDSSGTPVPLGDCLVRLRALQVAIDTCVRDAYGWQDIALNHGFHAVPYLPANDNIRYTISEPARLEILRRLALLNHERWEEEEKKGLHKKNGGK